MDYGFISFLMLCWVGVVAAFIIWQVRKAQYRKTTRTIQEALGIDRWLYLDEDFIISLKSAASVDKYDYITFFKENRDRLDTAKRVLESKRRYVGAIKSLVFDGTEFKSLPMISRVEEDLNTVFLKNCFDYSIKVCYSSPTGRSTRVKTISITEKDVDYLLANPSLTMSKSEYNQYVKEHNKEALDKKHREYYDRVNDIIDFANNHKESLIIKGDKDELDRIMASLFDRTVNSIKKIKSTDSEEWDMLDGFIKSVSDNLEKVFTRNQKILDYYKSADFERIKTTCDSLMDSQREFNKYIDEKAASISKLFGTRIVRNETVVEDEYNYIRPYQKSLTPFTAEVSAQVFASAENNPIDYIVKYFYPNKALYPEQIQKLQLLVEELETLREAKQIIENYKKDYQKYLTDVPVFIMENDEDGFYSRLGFANVSESVLTVEYKFSYTSGGGMAQRNFTIPMTEETIVGLINVLQSKLTMSSFSKEQRALMTSKLRQQIKERDNYTCKLCGNSTHKEPNLLLEIDHIVPVAKGGYTVENNLQTLCWKCNRSKSDKLISAL